ncbi:MAG: Spy/CpxP family protein refolding chaperone [Acidobacteria bacterium]|nr:Spy/CpxP family protein refolding chaperone [Acidobacteriota bacterium]
MKSRFSLRILLALVAAVFVGSIVAAQPPGRGPRMGGFPLGDLTDAQRSQVRALMQKQRQARGEPAMPQLMDQLRAEVFADTPDVGKIEQLKTQIAAAQAAELASHIELQTQVAQILTPEQRQQAREGRGHLRGPRRRGRPDAGLPPGGPIK